MAQQITNTFLKSKMNKDLDDRILPNGEYRDARNISVGRSEDNDVGALENVIGNDLVASTDIGNGLTIIGIHKSNSTDEIFVFLTDYTDPLPSTPTNAPAVSLHYIYVYNNSNKSYTRLVQGEFLNFSTTNRIIGINLIERLLFWTDNRNQPRKINVNLANPTQGGGKQQEYYTEEHQISVAKYNPYQPIELYNRIDVEITSATSGYFQVPGDQTAKFTPFIGATVVSPENNISGDQFIKVIGIGIQAGNTRVSVSPSFTTPLPSNNSYLTLISSTMTNQNDNAEWPGDPDYLEDRFVRFSYRFKYDDNEYSLMAPFTQIAYIPKQGGFFIDGDENSAYQSTIVDFMENFVQNVGLVIPLPTSANRLLRDYKISELEILFRESDSVAVKVLESISTGEVRAASGVSNYYTYDYQSRKPYKTLPEAQTVRVYDKVPVRAFSQESSGNRIIYGNYRDQHTPPTNLNYNCVVSDKFSSGTSNNWVEYPNHSVKRNRNYQIGFVLADKFGRQSPVILSSVDAGVTSGGSFFSGSTIYSSYDLNQEDTVVRDWFGDSIKVIVNAKITSNINTSEGTPGLYAIEQQKGAIGTGIGFATSGSPVIVSDSIYTFSLDTVNYPNNDNIPIQGDSMRGAYEDFVKVTNITGPSGGGQIYTVTTSGRVNDVYLRANNLPANTPDLKFAYTINDLGWYSYKIVVKQTEQEYYNVYLPGILNGYPGQNQDGLNKGPFPTNETDLTAFTSLYNDNINKIPRDLQEVGPEQKQFRSSVTLYGRVTNVMNSATPNNKQYYARLSSQGKNAIAHTSTAIANAKEVNMGFEDLSPVNAGVPAEAKGGINVFYQIETNPLIARISTTEKSIGATALKNPAPNVPTGAENMLPFLAIYETEPVESLLDIYWETTTAGLIVDLNTDIASGSGAASSFQNVNWEFKEDFVEGDFVTGEFSPLNEEGDPYLIGVEAELMSVIDGSTFDAAGLFTLESGVGAGTFKLKFDGPSQFFIDGSETNNVYTFEIEIKPDGEVPATLTLGGIPGGEGAMQNVVPSFVIDGAISKTPEDLQLIPPVPLTASAPWTSLPENGSSTTDVQSKKSQLVYTIEGINTTVIPDNWEMNPSTGELTQAIPGDEIDGVAFLGNAPVVYQCIIKVTDADALAPNGFYGSLTAQRNVDISLGYSAVNPGLISSTCLITPPVSGPGPFDPWMRLTSTNEVQSKVFYINDDESLEAFDFESFTNSSNNLQSAVQINTYPDSEGHKRGTLAFTFNIYQEEEPGTTDSTFSIDTVELRYRILGEGGSWNILENVNEYNSVGGYSVSEDVPGGTNFVFTSANTKWYQTVRAYDYSTLASSSGDVIEYAVFVKNIKLISGTKNLYCWVTADDLHYPECVTWQGLRVDNSLGNNPFYTYERSSESDSNLVNTVTPDAFAPIYAETPFGDYVNQFYTDTNFATPYTPTAGTTFINFRLKLDAVDPNLTLFPWTTKSGTNVTPEPLQWVAEFDSVTGNKLLNPTSFTKAVQTSEVSTPLLENSPLLNGTARIKNSL